MTKTSRLRGFHKLPPAERLRHVAAFAALEAHEVAVLADVDPGALGRAARMIENVIGVYDLPVGIAANFRIDGRDRLVPMVVEEPSVVAAASNAARMLREGDGIATRASDPIMISQIQLLDVPDIERATSALKDAGERLVAEANAGQPRLVARGGGARSIEVRVLRDTEVGSMVVVHLLVDVCDSMGANLVNQMAEQLAPVCEELTGGRAHLRILSNLSDRRLVHVIGRVPLEMLALPKHGWSGAEVADRIAEASIFAEHDPYRAATHNKGLMNGVDAVLLATGQDFRAVESGAHAYAARNGRYGALATWRREGEELVGRLTMPMAVGIVGGVTRTHPVVQVLLKVLGAESASELGRVAAAAGLAQNLGAIRALATEGIQRGHMSLHARNIAAATGAKDATLDRIVSEMVRLRTITHSAAEALLREEEAREKSLRAERVRAALFGIESSRAEWWPDIERLIERVFPRSIAEDGLEAIAWYHIDAGGKRLRPMLALLVHGALGRPAEEVLPFAAATELLHNGTLIHDDAEVRERLRRGREAVWARFGLDQAINCGDAMLFGALKCLESLEIAPRQARRLGALVTDHMLRIIRAEVGHPEPWSDAWIERARSRTGGLFALALAGSALLAGVPEGALHTLEVVGGQLGVVFQAQEELLALSRSDLPGAVSVERAVEVIDSHRREVQRLAGTIEEPALSDLLSSLADVLLAPLVPPA